jgi:Ca2+-dependent lipid-binding protein
MSYMDKIYFDKLHLKLEIKTGKDLAAMDLNGKSDPYCVIKMLGGNEQKTSICYKTLNPSFYQDFFCETKLSKEEIAKNDEAIVIDLWDKDKIGKDDFLGRVIIPGKSIVEGLQEVWLPLKPRVGQEKKDKKVKGELNVSLHYREPLKLSEEELSSLKEISHFNEFEIKNLFDNFKQVGLGQELTTSKDLEQVLLKASTSERNWIETLMR